MALQPALSRITRPLALATALATAFGSPLRAEGYLLGAGLWTCAQVIDAVDSGQTVLVGQAAHWTLGFWSATTFNRETSFVDTVESVGGPKIWDITVEECRKAPPETMLYTVTDALITNTR